MSGPKHFEFAFNAEAEARLAAQKQERQRVALKFEISQLAASLQTNLKTLTGLSPKLKQKVEEAVELVKSSAEKVSLTESVEKLQTILKSLEATSSAFDDLTELQAQNLFGVLKAGLQNETLRKWQASLPSLSGLEKSLDEYTNGIGVSAEIITGFPDLKSKLEEAMVRADELQSQFDRRLEIVRALVDYYRSQPGFEMVFSADASDLATNPALPLHLILKHSSGSEDSIVLDLDLADVIRTPGALTDNHLLVHEIIDILANVGVSTKCKMLRDTDSDDGLLSPS